VSPLSAGVAITAAIALVAGVTKEGVDVLGLAADPTLLSIGAVGLMLALTTFRSSLISPFLRVFSTIFAVEYVVTRLAYVAVEAGWWPPSLAEVAPPASLPITFAIFGLLVYLISFIPVIGQITRLADPYSSRMTELLQSGLVQRDSKQGLRRVLVALVRGVLLLGGDLCRQQPD
jgi:vitamin B12/bleomycin/antimicrobial peptide transport system ATP-binding/permease protein